MFWKIFSLAGIQSPWEQTGHPVPPSSHADSGRSICDHKNTAGSDLFWEIRWAEPIQRPGSSLPGPAPGLLSQRRQAEKQKVWHLRHARPGGHRIHTTLRLKSDISLVLAKPLTFPSPGLDTFPAKPGSKPLIGQLLTSEWVRPSE